ncbi:MAG: ComEC/Rec2 family competence protein [Patescibacteria group bacterium]
MNKGLVTIAGLVILIGIAAAVTWPRLQLPERVRIVICDIGQGDAILIQASGHYDLLIDGGPNRQVLSCLGKYLGFWDRQVELLVATHPDADHSTGLALVAEQYQISQILWTNLESSTLGYQALQQLVAEQPIAATVAVAGQQWPVGPATMDILWPLTDLTGQRPKSTNNTSIVSRVVFDSVAIMLTGDAEIPVEQELLRRYPVASLQSTMLKVGHHGSKSSTTAAWLAVVKPTWALISVGAKNRYGHPTAAVLARLAASGAEVRRTDQQGDIVLMTDGQTVRDCSAGLDFFCWWW